MKKITATRATVREVRGELETLQRGEAALIQIRGSEWFHRAGCTDGKLRTACRLTRTEEGWDAVVFNPGEISGKTVPLAILGKRVWVTGLSVNGRTDRRRQEEIEEEAWSRRWRERSPEWQK